MEKQDLNQLNSTIDNITNAITELENVGDKVKEDIRYFAVMKNLKGALATVGNLKLIDDEQKQVIFEEVIGSITSYTGKEIKRLRSECKIQSAAMERFDKNLPQLSDDVYYYLYTTPGGDILSRRDQYKSPKMPKFINS